MARSVPLTIALFALAACGDTPTDKASPAKTAKSSKSKVVTEKPAPQAADEAVAETPKPTTVDDTPGSTSTPAVAAPSQPDTDADTDAATTSGSGGSEPEPAAEIEPRDVPVKLVQAAAAQAPWRTVATVDAPLKFEPLLGGVLGKSAAGYHDVDENGALVLRSEIESTPHPIVGYWPKNAWHVEVRDKKVDVRDRSDGGGNREIRLMRLRGKRRWVPQAYEFEQRFLDEGHKFAVGGKGGMLVELRGSVARVGGQSPPPEIGNVRGNSLKALFETKSGRLYTVHKDGEALYVQRDCQDQACVAANSMKLPNGTKWAFGSSIRRRRHSLTAMADLQALDGTTQAHLLHYAAGGWKLEALAEAPRGLWPTKDGGLWVAAGDELLHRDPEGQWRSVGVPDGATSVTAAMHGDAGELWIAATVGEKTVVYATHANAQQDAPPQPTAP